MILDDIVARKKLTLEESKYIFDVLNTAEKIKESNIPDFYYALKKEGLSIIGEVKKASPSRGVIKEDFHPVDIAVEYGECVDAISVLTEEHFFQGKPEYLVQIKEKVNIPILRKDFIISPLQITQARELGASAVLLICAVLKEKWLLKEFLSLTHSLGMYALIETHNEEEVELALNSGGNIIGVNNRNLKDFSEDIYTTERLAKLIGDDKVIVSESSIKTVDDIKVVAQAGADAVLVGESFMRTDNITEKANSFKRAYAQNKKR